MKINVFFKDKCFSDYIQDFHDRPGECLVSIEPYWYKHAHEVARAILDNLEINGSNDYDDLPSDDAIMQAIVAASLDKHGQDTTAKDKWYWPVDQHGNEIAPDKAEEFDEYLGNNDTPKLWILLRWKD